MTFDAAEKHQSQIPALQMLVALGYTPLSQAEALRLRGGRLRNVVLDEVLADQLLKINAFTYRDRTHPFDLEDAHEAIRRLKPTPDRQKGLRGTNQDIYDSLVLGTTITKTIQGDAKSYSFRYIDWEQPSNNVFHVSAELSVERTASTQTRRCDIVGFVNGIPFLVIETGCEHCRGDPVICAEGLGMSGRGRRVERGKRKPEPEDLAPVVNGQLTDVFEERLALYGVNISPSALAVDKSARLEVCAIARVQCEQSL